MDKKRWMIVALAVLGVAGVFALGLFAGDRLLNGGGASEPTATPATTSPTSEPAQAPASPEEFVDFRSEEHNFALSYPGAWERLEPNSPEIPLLVTRNGRDSFLVRVSDLGFEIAPEDFPSMRSVADQIVKANPEATILVGPDQIEMDGLPGYFYLYTFRDADSGEQGVHSHYFLFEGDKLTTLVFQALPIDGFGQLAPTFDVIAQSFRRLDKPTGESAEPQSTQPATTEATP